MAAIRPAVVARRRRCDDLQRPVVSAQQQVRSGYRAQHACFENRHACFLWFHHQGIDQHNREPGCYAIRHRLFGGRLSDGDIQCQGLQAVLPRLALSVSAERGTKVSSQDAMGSSNTPAFPAISTRPYAPTTDSSGNTIINTATGSREIIYPTFGLAGEYHPARNLEFELNGSGFAIPHHGDIGDAEASISYRLGHVELVVAEKYFHFETSPQNSQYFKTTLLGAYGLFVCIPAASRSRACFAGGGTPPLPPASAPSETSTEAAAPTSNPPSPAAGETPATSGANQPSVSSRSGTSSSSAPPPGVYVAPLFRWGHTVRAGAGLNTRPHQHHKYLHRAYDWICDYWRFGVAWLRRHGASGDNRALGSGGARIVAAHRIPIRHHGNNYEADRDRRRGDHHHQQHRRP